MPWHLESDNPDCPGYAVVKDDDGAVAGCHKTEADAKAQLAALYANEEAAMPENPEDETRLANRPPAETRTDHPRTDLYRAMQGGITSEDGKTLTIRLAPHDQWAEIKSVTEGHFMERFSRTAYRKTMAERLPKILFQHGKDPEIGEKPIATTDEVGEDATSPFARGQILDGVPALVVDGIRKGVYGASHRFSVVREKWDDNPIGGPHNPQKLPERTITEALLHELGPVTWPAYANASASLRSLTDEYRGILPATEPEAPSLDAAVEEPHLEPERRDEPVVVAAIQPEEKSPMDYDTIDEKKARVREITDEMQALAARYTGVLPDAEQATWDALDAEQERLQADIAATEARNRRIEDLVNRGSVETPPAPQAPPTVNVIKKTSDPYDIAAIRKQARSAEEVDSLFRDNALRSVEQASKRYDVNGLANIVDYKDEGEEGKGEIARRVLLTGSPAYRSAFMKYLRGERDLWTPEESRAAALAVTGTTTTGGYAVPYVFDATMLRIGSHVGVNAFRSACRIETITNGNNWRTVTVGAITAAYGTEASAASEGGPTFGQPSYTVQTAKAFATVSVETMQDRPDIADELTKVFGEAKDNLEASEFATGTGLTVYPLGMFTDTAYTNKDTATNDVTAITDMTALEGDLPIRHRMNAAFFMSRSTLRQLEALDTTGYYFKRFPTYFAGGQAQPANVPSGASGTELLGYPVYEVPGAASTLTTDGAIIVVFADPKSYVIVDRIGMNVEVIPQMLNGATPSFPTLQRGVICYWRNTAKPINADAGRSLSVQ